MMVKLGSVWRGMRAQRHVGLRFWSVRLQRWGWWAQAWTPIWHDGRGPYVSLGIGFIAVYRGY